MYSFICQGTSTRRQRSDLCGLRVKLPPSFASSSARASAKNFQREGVGSRKPRL